MYDEDGNPIAVLTNNDKAGNIRYLDIDKDGKITASNDRVRLGNSLPELQYGGSLWAEWKTSISTYHSRVSVTSLFTGHGPVHRSTIKPMPVH